uniref:Calcineurin-like phosphoesterase domain-containing protein n=1 Tax=Globisporangium ultimum (strain ATCC 200006 / CBS 805.95 / DAOM BR144) TaxID=431595 RepID=K3X9X6_GLOUD
MEDQRGQEMTRAAAAAALASRHICFLTDVEGNWNYVRNFVRQSTCLRLTPTHDAQHPQPPEAVETDGYDEDLELNDDCFLVFGGDAGDKGGETLKCYEQLVRLKKKHPERVVLLAGNRDVNKMRFTSELDDSEMGFKTMAKETSEGPIWVPEKKRFTLKKFLASQLVAQCAASGQPVETAEEELVQLQNEELLGPANTKVNRLKWILEHTMGSQGDFERRRKELVRRHRSSLGESATISDDAVLQSFMESVQEGGVLREYLELGSLAFVAYNTLFVHGGLISGAGNGISSLGRVPDEPNQEYRSVTEWVDKLNAWYLREVRAWIDRPLWTPDRTTRGGNELLKYVLPGYPASVVMGRHLEKSGMPTELPSDVVQRLSESGINRLIVGHTPHGTCPTVIKQDPSEDESLTAAEAGFAEVVMCDTSYSDMQASDSRGRAASEVVLDPNGHAHVHGVLENGRPIAFATDDPVIGQMLRDGTHVKAKLSDTLKGQEDEYLVCSVENGFSYTYHYRKRHELQELLK